MVEVGSVETHSRRRIFHILGQNGVGRAGRLLVSELYGDDGCWSGYPPHKHDTERAPEETDFEEEIVDCLHHITGDDAEKAYKHGEALRCGVLKENDGRCGPGLPQKHTSLDARVLVTVTGPFRRVCETRRERKARCPAPPIRIR